VRLIVPELLLINELLQLTNAEKSGLVTWPCWMGWLFKKPLSWAIRNITLMIKS
jgi:hypothetical protein